MPNRLSEPPDTRPFVSTAATEPRRDWGIFWRALRTPALMLLVVSLPIADPTLIPNLTILVNYFASVKDIGESPLYHLLHNSNVVIYLGCLIAAIALVEVKQLLAPQNRSLRADLVTAVAWISFSLAAPLLSVTVGAGLAGSWKAAALQVATLSGFMLLNSSLYVFSGYPTGGTWIGRLREMMFPLSDIVLFVPMRRYLGSSALRFVPISVFTAILVAGFVYEGQVFFTGQIARTLEDRSTQYAYQVKFVDGGFWYLNTDRGDPKSGLWFYDDRTRQAKAVIPFGDPVRFRMRDGFVYFYDRSTGTLRKMFLATQTLEWEVPLPRYGSFEVEVHNGHVVAVGEKGYVVVLDDDGHLLAERTFPYRTVNLQILTDGRITVMNGDISVLFLKPNLSDSEIVPLPLSRRILRLTDGASGQWVMKATTWTEYLARENQLYVATLWGEVFRYDVAKSEWRAESVRGRWGVRAIAVDSQSNLLFLANYFGGFIEVHDLHTGKLLQYIVAGNLGRNVNLDPSGQRGIFTTKGAGMYRFDYPPWR